jgi:photosynthetic reaction center H subunit
MWVDRAEMLFRYIELQPTGSSQPVLLPINFGVIRADGVHVHALYAHQFANVPKTRAPEKVTFLEEEKIMAYYGAGLLYADPVRQEPLV